MGRESSEHGKMRNTNKMLFEKTERKDHSEDLDIDGRSKLTWVLGKEVWTAWIRFSWFRIGTGGGIFCARIWTFRFRIMRWIYWPAERIIWLVKKVPARYSSLVNKTEWRWKKSRKNKSENFYVAAQEQCSTGLHMWRTFVVVIWITDHGLYAVQCIAYNILIGQHLRYKKARIRERKSGSLGPIKKQMKCRIDI
jgi:hypothetical protein